MVFTTRKRATTNVQRATKLNILSNSDRSKKYARLSENDRVAIVEILRDTKNGLPDYFRP